VLAHGWGEKYRSIMKPITVALALLVLGLSSFAARAAEPEAARPATLPAISEVKTNERGFFIVNGKPFFPILLYDLPVKDEAAVKDAVAKGFNVLTTHTAEEAAALLPHGFYGAIHANKKVENGQGVLLVLSLDSPALEIKENLIPKTQEYNAKAAANLPGRPVANAIGYWLGEPQGVKDNTLPGKDKYEDLVNAIDVSAPYLYPVPYQPVSTVGDAVKRAHDATGGKKALLPILQLFKWEPGARYPTPGELRAMVFLSLIEGATGIGYYTYNSVKDAKDSLPKELWDSVGPLNKEVAEIGAFLTAAEADDSLNLADAATPVRMRVARQGKTGIMLLVNPTDKEQTFSIEMKSTMEIRLDQKSMIGLTGAINKYTLQPFQTQFWQFTLK